MSNIQSIVDNISQSVLVIGPGIFHDKDGKSIVASFSKKLKKESSAYIDYYFEHDNLFKLKNSLFRSEVLKGFEIFYRHEFLSKMKELYSKIYDIPFPLIISLNPDNPVEDYFSVWEKGNKYHFYHFKIGNKKKHEKEDGEIKELLPTSEHPFWLNLYGKYNDQESLILEYIDLFNYFRNIFPTNSLPDKVRDFLKTAKTITFLGVEFDKWYFQLLVQMLTETDPKFANARFASPERDIEQRTYCVCEKNFEIKFVGYEAMSFINELHFRCLKKYKYNEENIVFEPEIFISYHGDDLNQVLIDKLFEKARSKKMYKYKLSHYKAEMGYKDDKWSFMKRMGWGKYIIIILNKEYLHSEYCMFELKEIMDKGSDFEERLFPVVMSGFNIDSTEEWNNYKKFWQNELTKEQGMFGQMESEDIADSLLKIVRYEEIKETVPRFKKFIQKYNDLRYADGDEKIIDILFDKIKEKIDFDLSI